MWSGVYESFIFEDHGTISNELDPSESAETNVLQ